MHRAGKQSKDPPKQLCEQAIGRLSYDLGSAAAAAAAACRTDPVPRACMLPKPGWPLMLLPCSLPAAESWGAPEGLCSQPRHDAELPGAAGPCAVRRRPQGKGAPGWPASSPADRRLGTAVTAVPAVSLLECMPQHGCLNPAWMQVVDSWWHGLPVVTTPIGAEGMSRADADPRDVSAAGAAAGAARAAGRRA